MGIKRNLFSYFKDDNSVKKFKDIFLYFIFYSVLGWIYEVFLEVVVYKWGFSNRGVLFGPYCPIYGFGAIIFICLFTNGVKKYRSKVGFVKYILFLFFASAIIATLIELAASYILEYFTGSWPWQTYVDYAVNFQGRIALSTSVRFGLGALIIILFIQPVLEALLKSMPQKVYNIVLYLILFVFSADLALLIYNYLKL